MKKLFVVLPLAVLAVAASCSDSAVGPAEWFAPKPLFDEVSNNVDADIDATLEVMNLAVPGANGTTQLRVQPRNDDGKSGCNLTGSTTLVVSVSSSNTAAATVSPSSVTFGSCDDVHTLTVTPVAAGSATISLSQTSNTTEGTFNLAPATFTVNVTSVDASPPVISYTLNPASPDGNNGWYKSDVTLTWNVSEPQSPSSLVKTGCVDQNITADQSLQAYSCSATSAGGSAGPVTVSIKRDATAPSVSLVGGPADGESYYFNSVPAAPTCSASDALSGLAGSCGVSGYSATVGGPYTVTATATDNAGNTNSASATYSVLAWNLSGFYSPVNMDALNTAKSGSTVPLKFEIFAGSLGENEQTSTNAVRSFVSQLIPCSVADDVGPEDPIDLYTTGGTSLRYDATGGQFIQNWQTPKNSAGKCYRVTMTALDGSTITANFKLK